MSNFLSGEQPVDPFNAHPRAHTFISAALEAREKNPDGHIDREKLNELRILFKLDTGEAAALAYLAEHKAEEVLGSLESDISNLEQGGEIQ